MGRVIKGSTESPQRFTLAVPALLVPAPAGSLDETQTEQDVLPDGALYEPIAPPPPEIDFAALAAQAQQVIDDAERSAQGVIAAAQERARAIVEEGERASRALAEDARRAAHDDGYASGRDDATADMAGMIDTMRELLSAVRTERHALLTAAEPELVRLAVGIAERVLHGQIALDHGVVVEMAKAAITRLVDREKITVRVNPADVERMREHRDELLALGDVKTMRVIEDQRVDRGGVVLETDAGSVDAKISTQLNEVRKILHIVDDIVVQPASTSDESDESPRTASRAS